MKILIVYAHENPASFNGTLKDLAVETLTQAGHEVKVSDLYSMKFNPIAGRHDFTDLSGEEFYKYQAEQSSAASTGRFARDVQEEMDKVDWADFLLFQYPVWWFDMPAILKGWVDRVFAAGYAYGGGNMFDKGLLKGKRAMCSVTTGGPEAGYPDPDGNLMRNVQFGRLYFCGMEVLPVHVSFSAAHLDDAERQAYLDSYRKRLETIETTKPLEYPTLAEMGLG